MEPPIIRSSEFGAINYSPMPYLILKQGLFIRFESDLRPPQVQASNKVLVFRSLTRMNLHRFLSVALIRRLLTKYSHSIFFQQIPTLTKSQPSNGTLILPGGLTWISLALIQSYRFRRQAPKRLQFAFKTMAFHQCRRYDRRWWLLVQGRCVGATMHYPADWPSTMILKRWNI